MVSVGGIKIIAEYKRNLTEDQKTNIQDCENMSELYSSIVRVNIPDTVILFQYFLQLHTKN